MFSSTFIFAKKLFDEEFHTLDAQIAGVARSLPGYIGEESWENTANGLVSNVYYWRTLAVSLRPPASGFHVSGVWFNRSRGALLGQPAPEVLR